MVLLSMKTAVFKVISAISLAALLTACGDSDGGGDPIPNAGSPPASGHIIRAVFRDDDGRSGKLAGIITIETAAVNVGGLTESLWLYWADQHGNRLGDVWLKTPTNNPYEIIIPIGTAIPDQAQALVLLPSNRYGQASQGRLVNFHDFTGNAELSGPGGNRIQTWQYGLDRPKIAIQRSDEPSGLCVLDNGLVSVIDMNNSRDELWEAAGLENANSSNDTAFPPYDFSCSNEPVNNERKIMQDGSVWTYSTLNDAMFYGTVVYDTFLEYLGEPPLNEKLRLRVHYGPEHEIIAAWDGVYANFSDSYLMYSMATLDVIGHEIGHGVLNRISDLKVFEHPISKDARTLHEAFADISGLMAKYELATDKANFISLRNSWTHGAESRGIISYSPSQDAFTRQLDQIRTEADAIDSWLDYDQAGDNPYLRTGMITYPFYLLTRKWGVETSYRVYISAARNCWGAMTTLTEAAHCIRQQAALAGLPEEDVVTAFKAVKIRLFEEGVLSHFKARQYKLRIAFSDNSRGSHQVSQWLWDFGDGVSSTVANPEHYYSSPGVYRVSLTVIDQGGDQDSFTRIMTFTDQYCPISYSTTPSNTFTGVSINGNDLNYDNREWDYSESTIVLENPASVAVNIQGNNAATTFPTTWKMWIDLNNDGVYGDQAGELVNTVVVPAGQPFALNTHLNLSALSNDGEAKYMRIIADHVAVSPCDSYVGEALDIKVSWPAQP